MAVNRAVSSHGVAWVWLRLAFRTRRSYGRADGTAAPGAALYTRGESEGEPPRAGMRGMSQRSLGGGSAVCPGLPPPTWNGAPAALGLGLAGSAPGGRRTLRSA